MRYILVFFAIVLVGFPACKKKSGIKSGREISYVPGPPTIVYQTKKDYSKFVAVSMNEEKTAIVSYPHPRDIKETSKPMNIKGKYYLDNQGVDANMAITAYTFEEYSKMPEAPSMDNLMKKITEKDPLISFCNCGLRTQYKDLKAELTAMAKNKFKDCRKIK